MQRRRWGCGPSSPYPIHFWGKLPVVVLDVSLRRKNDCLKSIAGGEENFVWHKKDEDKGPKRYGFFSFWWALEYLWALMRQIGVVLCEEAFPLEKKIVRSSSLRKPRFLESSPRSPPFTFSLEKVCKRSGGLFKEREETSPKIKKYLEAKLAFEHSTRNYSSRYAFCLTKKH